MAAPDLPILLEWAAIRLGVDVRPQPLTEHRDVAAYRADLSRFRLRLSERTPCLQLPFKLNALPPAQIKQVIDDILRVQGWTDRNVLVLCGGNADELRLLYRRDLRPPIVLDTLAQARIMAGGPNSNALVAEISRQTHITALAPYEVNRPVTGEQFFGRDAELRQIQQNASTSFLIIGNRRMGKSSLMLETMRRARGQGRDGDANQYFDCSVFASKLDLWGDVARRLAPREVERVYHDPTFSMAAFLQRMARARGGKITLHLDEIDHLLEWDARDNWSVLNTLRAACAGARDEAPVRVLMAGFRVAHDWARRRDAPLFNFATQLRVTSFDLRETEQLVAEPMLNLGITFADRGAVAHRIFRETGGQPNLIQYYCLYLIRRLEATDQRVVSADLLDDAMKDNDIRRRTADELVANSTNLEQLVIFCFLAYGWREGAPATFSLADADGWLKKHEVELVRGDLESALDALETSGVLARDGRDYGFSFLALPRALLASREPAYQIRKILEEGL